MKKEVPSQITAEQILSSPTTRNVFQQLGFSDAEALLLVLHSSLLLIIESHLCRHYLTVRAAAEVTGVDAEILKLICQGRISKVSFEQTIDVAARLQLDLRITRTNTEHKSNAPDPEALLDAREAAKYLGVRKGTLACWRCVKRYPLPYVKVGKSIRYKRSDLDAFIEFRKKSGDGSDT